MRLIDADAIPYCDDDSNLKGCKYVRKRTIDNMPTIEAEPIKHGRWIYKGKRGRFPVCECSVCGNAENADWAIMGDNANYCPNCGALMDEVVE